MAKPLFEPRTFTQEEIQLATEALNEARVALMMEFRFLDTSLWHMPWKACDCPMALSTDGKTLFYNPIRVITTYAQNQNELVRDLLHLILHCILHHPFDTSHPEREAWSIACDITAESIALQMCDTRFSCEYDDQKRAFVNELTEQVGLLTPIKIYQSLLSTGFTLPGVSNAEITKLRRLFNRDAHDVWALWRMQDEQDSHSQDDQSLMAAAFSNDSSHDSSQETTLPVDDIDGDASQGNDAGCQGDSESADAQQDAQTGEGGSQEPDEDEKAWNDISEQIQVNLETFSQDMGTKSGNLMVNLSVANHKAVDYADFLRRFSTLTEECRINDDEFDYIFYTFGLDHYGNMPLVEPLEYQEVERIHDFVIAIDTSGSCSGELVRAFLHQTHDILVESSRFGEHMNVHVIQCDSRIQFDSTVSSVEEFENLEKNFVLKGFGGTDFRPVFDYVEELKENRQLSNLKGLIYFTDGIGTYPAHPPDYQVAFAFVGTDDMRRSVPPWAMKIVLDEETIRQMQ